MRDDLHVDADLIHVRQPVAAKARGGICVERECVGEFGESLDGHRWQPAQLRHTRTDLGMLEVLFDGDDAHDGSSVRCGR